MASQKKIKNMNKITICGIGPGNKQLVLPAVLEAVADCEVLLGGKRHLEEFALPGQRTVRLNGHETELREAIQTTDAQRITLLVSGDTGFHSLLRTFKRLFPQMDVRVIPGISTYQYFFAQLQLSYEDAYIGSLHGTSVRFTDKVQHHRFSFLLTDRHQNWKYIVQQLVAEGLGQCRVYVGNRLSYADECIVSATAAELAQQEHDFDLCAVIVENSEFKAHRELSYGLPDETFVRGKVPMTKEEVRAVVLSKLSLRSHDHLVDVGAGTGSVALEAARLLSEGRVTALESNEEAVKLIYQNALQLGINNLEIHQGTAASLLPDCRDVTRVFIGGSGGELADIVQWVAEKTASETVVVITAVTLNTLEESRRLLLSDKFGAPEVVQVAVTRVEKVGNSDMLKAQSPVWIIRAVRK
jgi:precorrin-6B C5,15-methyltransferase / cobalt-precorrin-6B C5,C15-methyltransferase